MVEASISFLTSQNFTVMSGRSQFLSYFHFFVNHQFSEQLKSFRWILKHFIQFFRFFRSPWAGHVAAIQSMSQHMNMNLSLKQSLRSDVLFVPLRSAHYLPRVRKLDIPRHKADQDASQYRETDTRPSANNEERWAGSKSLQNPFAGTTTYHKSTRVLL